MDIAETTDPARADDLLDAELREVDAAVELVASGAAVRVELVGLSAAGHLEDIGLDHARHAGIAFRAERSGPTLHLTIGPVEAR